MSPPIARIVAIITFTDDLIAEIHLDHSASAEHVFDAMDLVRLMLEHGVVAAKIIHWSKKEE